AEEVKLLLAAIRRNIADARVTAISDETRFDAA
ncbi:MAG: DNA-binding protein, partial [Desulfuromonas sp.]